MNDTILLAERHDGVTLITLNRPEVMNSFDFELLHAWSSLPVPRTGHFAPVRI